MNAARVLKRRAFQSAPQRAAPSRSEEFVLTAQNKFSETNFLREPKPRFWQSAPHLPHTCGFCGKSEFAAFIKGVPLKYAAKRENRSPSEANGGFSLPSEDFVLSAQNKISETIFHEVLWSHL